MSRPTLDVATAAVQRLPNLSGSTRQLLGYLNDESVELKIIVRAIECDQGLTIGVLRVANSPFYGMPNQVQTIHDAVVLLGFSNLRMIIVATMASSLQFPNLGAGTDVRTLFRHGLAVAISAARGSCREDGAVTSGPRRPRPLPRSSPRRRRAR